MVTHNYKGISYYLLGNPDNPPVLFLHGFLGDHRDWNKVINKVIHDFYCLTIDLPGHGKSTNPDLIENLWNFEAFCLWINEFFSYLQVNKVNVVGYSMGGRIAQHYAIQFPQRIVKMVLESSSFGIKDKTEQQLRYNTDRKRSLQLMNESYETFLNQWYAQSLFGRIKRQPGFAEMFQRRLSNNPELLAKALRAFGAGRQSYLGEKLSDLKIPIALICGTNDDKYLKIMQKAQWKNPDYKLIVMKDCAHNTHFEKPNLFAEHLVEFLSL